MKWREAVLDRSDQGKRRVVHITKEIGVIMVGSVPACISLHGIHFWTDGSPSNCGSIPRTGRYKETGSRCFSSLSPVSFCSCKRPEES